MRLCPRVMAPCLLILAGCSSPPTPPGDAQARIALFREPASLDPFHHNDTFSWTITRNLFEGLVIPDASGALRPAIAASWSSPDDRTWVFELRQGVFFHDGRRVTAVDVLASIRRAREDPQSMAASALATLERVESPDERTVRIVTREPDPLLLYRLVDVVIQPGGGTTFEPIGTGPYRLSVHRPGEELELEVFPEYWGPRPEIRRATFVFESSTATARALLESGDLDLAALRVPDLEALRGHACCEILPVLAGAVYFLTLPVDREPWSDPRVREALDLAIDREAIVSREGVVIGLPASQMVAPTIFGYDPSIRAQRPDADAARRLLREAGIEELDVPVWHLEQQRIGHLTETLLPVGFRIVSSPLPTEELYRRRDAGELGVLWGAVIHPSGDATVMFEGRAHSRDPEAGRGGANLYGYSNPGLDELVDRAVRELDPEVRRELLQQGMRILREDRPYLPVFYPYTFFGHSRRFEWTARSDGTVRLIDARPASDRAR